MEEEKIKTETTGPQTEANEIDQDDIVLSKKEFMEVQAPSQQRRSFSIQKKLEVISYAK